MDQSPYLPARYVEIKLGPKGKRRRVGMEWSRWWHLWTFRRRDGNELQDGQVMARVWARSLHQALDKLRKRYDRRVPK